MPSIVLRTEDNQDVGILLLPGDEPVTNPGERGVMLMGTPFPSSSALAEFVQKFKLAVYPARVSVGSEGSQISFAVPSGISVLASIGATGAGDWSVGTIGSGRCQLLNGG